MTTNNELTAAGIFGDDGWQDRTKTELAEYLHRHCSGREKWQLSRALNALARSSGQSGGEFTLERMACIATLEMKGHKLRQYGPAAQDAIAHFFGDVLETYRKNGCPDRDLFTSAPNSGGGATHSTPSARQARQKLSVGYYTPTLQFRQITKHTAVMKAATKELAAVTGPAGNAESEAMARLFAAVPDLLAACRFGLTALQGNAPEALAIDLPATAIEKAEGRKENG